MIEALHAEWLAQQIPDLASVMAGAPVDSPYPDAGPVVDKQMQVRAESVVARAMGRR